MIPAPSAREALNDLSAACMTYFGHYGATHLDECPEDDTCDCPMVTALNAAIGKARKALQAPDELAEAVAAEREACAAVADEIISTSNRAGGDYEIGRANAGCKIAAAIRARATQPQLTEAESKELDRLYEEYRATQPPATQYGCPSCGWRTSTETTGVCATCNKPIVPIQATQPPAKTVCNNPDCTQCDSPNQQR